MASQNSERSVYTQVVHITRVYLGPAADRFIDRQVQNHLHKEPAQLLAADLDILIDWVKVAISLITEDSSIIEEYVAKLRRLAGNSHQGPVTEQPHATSTI